MDTKQYTITERNNHEGETFKYVVDLTDEEFETTKSKCQKFGNNTLSIEITNHIVESIAELNSQVDNGYMNFIAAYELKDGALENWEEFGDCFYKGVGLDKKVIEVQDVKVEKVIIKQDVASEMLNINTESGKNLFYGNTWNFNRSGGNFKEFLEKIGIKVEIEDVDMSNG